MNKSGRTSVLLRKGFIVVAVIIAVVLIVTFATKKIERTEAPQDISFQTDCSIGNNSESEVVEFRKYKEKKKDKKGVRKRSKKGKSSRKEISSKKMNPASQPRNPLNDTIPQ